jgi:hypothetical protein
MRAALPSLILYSALLATLPCVANTTSNDSTKPPSPSSASGEALAFPLTPVGGQKNLYRSEAGAFFLYQDRNLIPVYFGSDGGMYREVDNDTEEHGSALSLLQTEQRDQGRADRSEHGSEAKRHKR